MNTILNSEKRQMYLFTLHKNKINDILKVFLKEHIPLKIWKWQSLMYSPRNKYETKPPHSLHPHQQTFTECLRDGSKLGAEDTEISKTQFPISHVNREWWCSILIATTEICTRYSGGKGKGY